MSKGSMFGAPAGAPPAVASEEDEKLSLEESASVLDLPPVVSRRVDALHNLHKQYLAFQNQYHEEVRELERKYQKLYEPVFDKRAKILAGTHEPTDEEAHVEREEEEDEEKLKEASPEDANIVGIPNFWLTALQNSTVVGRTILEHDEEALEHLRDIRYAELEGEEKGFTLTFIFAENPFFTDTVLSKTYFMDQDELFGELQYDHATATKINWKSGKNLTVELIKKKLKSKGKKPARTQTIEAPRASFFDFFNPPQMPEGDELGEEEQEKMEMDLEIDFDVGCIIKDKIVPFSVLYFTGEATEYDADDDDDMFGEDDEDGEDEDDDGDDADEPPPPRKGDKRGGSGGQGHPFVPPPLAKIAGGAPGQPQQPECKQQ